MIQELTRIRASKPDFRDRVYKQTRLGFKRNVDLRQWDTLMEDQGYIGSCAGHTITTCYEIQEKLAGETNVEELSRLFVYYNARLLENSELRDEGITSIRDLMKAGAKYGLCTEKLWPYIDEKVNTRPDPICYEDGATRLVTNYRYLSTIADMLEVLSLDKPIVLGIRIFEGFMTPSSVIIDVPDGRENLVGGHAVAVLGYKEHERLFLIKNSFGPNWGESGYAWMTFDYIQQHAFEKWCFDVTKATNVALV